MIRSIDSLPTDTTFQQIIPYVSLGARLSTIIKGSNVYSDVDTMYLLVTMSKCLQNKAKECEIPSLDLKSVLVDQLLNLMKNRKTPIYPVLSSH